MIDDKLYTALREYARLAAETAAKLEVRQMMPELRAELRAEIPKEGPPGPKGNPGERGADSIVPGPKGDPGDLGKPGERGSNGIATREEMESLIEARFADIQVRTLADVFEGVYDASKLYPPGRLAVWDGQPWLSMTETRAMPGASSDWKLFAKKGRDGRDARK